MCSICGGTRWDQIAEYIWVQSQDRGRDNHGKYVDLAGNWVGNHRAIPTTEIVHPIEEQPVGEQVQLVFNGIISNDRELGIREGEADTSVLPRVLDFSSLQTFRDSLQNYVIGSYAIAVLFPDGNIWLACNYKPIWLLKENGEFYFSSLAQHFPDQYSPQRMKPYSVMDLNTRSSLCFDRNQSNQTIAICSAGLDSTTTAAYACHLYGPQNVTLLHFDYGCIAGQQEISHVRQIADYLGCSYWIQKMPTFGGSNLLEPDADISSAVDGAQYAHEWVPARNLVMLSLAVSFAEAKGFGHIYLGTNLEEAGAYPDNEEQFLLDFNHLLYGAVQNSIKVEIHTPLGGFMKHEIIPFGLEYGTPYHLTWSCYRGGDKHCGQCGPCYMRKTAFERNGMKDPVFDKE